MKPEHKEKIKQVIEALQELIKEGESPAPLVGWHKRTSDGSIVFFPGELARDGDPLGYGNISNLGWVDAAGTGWLGEFNPCPPEEVEEMLIAKAEKRGLVEGAKVSGSDEPISGYKFYIGSNMLFGYKSGFGGPMLFWDGQWAEVVKPSYTIQGDTISGLTEEQIQKVKEVLG